MEQECVYIYIYIYIYIGRETLNTSLGKNGSVNE